MILGRWCCVTWFFLRLPIQPTQAEQLCSVQNSCSACVGWIGRRWRNQSHSTQHQRRTVCLIIFQSAKGAFSVVVKLQTSRRFVSSCNAGTTSGSCGLLPGLVAGRLRGAALQQDVLLHNHGECPFGGLERRHCELYLKSWLSCWWLNNTEARGDFVISPVQLFTLMEFWCSVFSEKLTLSTIIKIN